ncbi:hypothetical protein [Latilactobacillus sakei]|uniref:hypothetical protein n=1 Tax=Latilactobacillus sakei TaxID=1599 RepID=UPI00055598E9|nr:hypothetical protein [Latilactobacillus sakei]ARJ72220.1 hypothetical protein LP065_06530 [Latilactobacillus sakei]PKX63912.1 hypothetical protein CUR38_01605 [Latilactobacillus sakei]PKX68819.1 hypothetical protein CUR40_02270 [Latilactobacillus sakei]
MTRNVDYDALHPSYKALWDLVGEENMLKIFNDFRGTQLQLPMRLYERNALEHILHGKDLESINVQELANRYGFSPRWIKEAIKK